MFDVLPLSFDKSKTSSIGKAFCPLHAYSVNSNQSVIKTAHLMYIQCIWGTFSCSTDDNFGFLTAVTKCRISSATPNRYCIFFKVLFSGCLFKTVYKCNKVK